MTKRDWLYEYYDINKCKWLHFDCGHSIFWRDGPDYKFSHQRGVCKGAVRFLSLREGIEVMISYRPVDAPARQTRLRNMKTGEVIPNEVLGI